MFRYQSMEDESYFFITEIINDDGGINLPNLLLTLAIAIPVLFCSMSCVWRLAHGNNPYCCCGCCCKLTNCPYKHPHDEETQMVQPPMGPGIAESNPVNKWGQPIPVAEATPVDPSAESMDKYIVVHQPGLGSVIPSGRVLSQGCLGPTGTGTHFQHPYTRL